MKIDIREDSKIPIYKQIANAIAIEIQSGNLTPGSQLPTVRDLAEKLTLATGTVKQAYDELGSMGLIEAIQGRGSFVAEPENPTDSRKERAMMEIETSIKNLADLEFTPTEMSIFFDLKLREYLHRQSDFTVSVVASAPEFVHMLSACLEELGGLDIYRNELESIFSHPYNIGEGTDLIVATETAYERLRPLVSDLRKLTRACLHLEPGCAASLAEIPAGRSFGILARSEGFAEAAAGAALAYAKSPKILPALKDTDEIASYAKKCDILIVPGNCSAIFPESILAPISDSADAPDIIELTYIIDRTALLEIADRKEQHKPSSEKI